ncbi:hypothetical protein FKW77_008158 [Venturia effusa]|uniref:Uncharacterized protein n=1 Tax=Venturia effusa TaxID=50376 RepID=A0A517L5X7_9PEZI|nr:hypothetical protein FKW77_008158 [Venturia effusa]
MSRSWSSLFGFGKKPTIAEDSASPTTEEEISSPLCCKALAQSALQQSPTYWQHAPKYQNRLKDFLTWLDTHSPHTPDKQEAGDDEWVEIASTTDLLKADFAFTILSDHSPTQPPQQREEAKFFIPLANHSFTQLTESTSITTVNPSSYLSTGNTIRLTCPHCKSKENGTNSKKSFKITLLIKKGRTIDMQLIDISNAGTRRKVGEMVVLFPGWRVEELRSVLLRKRGVVREAVEMVWELEREGGMRGG